MATARLPCQGGLPKSGEIRYLPFMSKNDAEREKRLAEALRETCGGERRRRVEERRLGRITRRRGGAKIDAPSGLKTSFRLGFPAPFPIGFS